MPQYGIICEVVDQHIKRKNQNSRKKRFSRESTGTARNAKGTNCEVAEWGEMERLQGGKLTRTCDSTIKGVGVTGILQYGEMERKST